jgi:hypothetical protein
MVRPFTRTQAFENAAFLRALARLGNARLAAAEFGVHRSTYTKRRARDPAFAAEWDAALALAQASLAGPGPGGAPRPRPVRTRAGRLQVRAARAGTLTPEAEQRFLLALSGTANVRLAARAAGFAHSTFYARARAHPAFAREWRLALEQGYEQVELALHESIGPDSYRDDAWRHNAPPALPPMTFDNALMLPRHHQREVLGQDEPPHLRRRRGESRDAHSYRLGVMAEEQRRRRREEFAVAEAARRARGERTFTEDDIPLPDLAQVAEELAAKRRR